MWVGDHKGAKLALLCCNFVRIPWAKEVFIFWPPTINGQPIIALCDWQVVRKGVVAAIKAGADILWSIKCSNAVKL